MSTGIITTAVVLIVGYVIVSKIIGIAFRLAVPLILVAILGGAGVFSGLMPGRSLGHYPADQYAPYGQVRPPSFSDGGSLGDLRLRDVADLAVDTVRSILQVSLALLNGTSDPASTISSRQEDELRHARRGALREPPADFYDDQQQGDLLRRP